MPIYRIADLIVKMIPKHQPLKDQSERYILTEGEYKIDLCIPDDTKAIHKYHLKHPELSIGEAEYMMYGTFFYHELLSHNGMMIHASAIHLNHEAFIFSGPSGIGKSTHVGYWKEKFNDSIIINDDKPAIRVMNQKVFVYGTPFSGKTSLNENMRAQVHSIFFIERSDVNWIKVMEDAGKFKNIMMNTILPYHEEKLDMLLDTIEFIKKTIPIYRLGCINNISAAIKAYTHVKGDLT